MLSAFINAGREEVSPLRSSGSDERQLLFVGEKQQPPRPPVSGPALLKAAVSWPLRLLCTQERDSHPQQEAGDKGAPSWSQFWVHLEWLEGLRKGGV